MGDDKRYAPVIRRLEKRMRNYVENGPTPGATLSVVTSAGPVWKEGFGYRDLAKSGPVDTQTIFQIGSTTKIFTGLSFMLAVQDGLVSLDDKVIDHWPDFTINSRHGPKEHEKITFRHLLSHRAGLPREPRIGGNFGSESPYAFEEMVESIKECWMVAPVNDRYYYSNIGMDIVAYSLQFATGMTYPSWVKKKLGVPLGMTTLRYGSGEALKEDNVAIGTETGRYECEFGASEDYGCGDVWIGQDDLSKVLILFLSEGKYKGTTILRNDLFRQMITPHFEKDQGFNYGLGVDIYGGFTPRILGHGGGSFGYASTFYWIPDFDFGVSVQTNREDYTGERKNPHELGKDAGAQLLKAHGVTLARKQPAEFLEEKLETPVVEDLSRLAGFYAGLWNNTVVVTLKGGKLYWHDQFELTPRGNGFTFPSGSAVRFNFKSKKSRTPYRVTYVGLKYPIAELNLSRVTPVGPNPNVPPIDTELAERITGIYKANYYGIEPTFNLAKVDDGQLLIQTEVGLRPAYPHESIKGLWFLPKGEAVTFNGRDQLWVENCRGVKWESPAKELRTLVKTDPKHRLLQKRVLNQIMYHLRNLGRKQEAKEVDAIKKEIHGKKKE
ncbi:MAG: class A beta-lactamase-related serine hydrolase [Candidatus Thorarchaeota archaeon]|nr:class A beta-lactamase-related serine hydrolase [Candidatus Thorarchaeota archaeon]